MWHRCEKSQSSPGAGPTQQNKSVRMRFDMISMEFTLHLSTRGKKKSFTDITCEPSVASVN